MEKFIYPNVEILGKEGWSLVHENRGLVQAIREVGYISKIRKKHTDGKWYLVNVMERVQKVERFSSEEEAEKNRERFNKEYLLLQIQSYRKFLEVAYRMLLFGQIDPEDEDMYRAKRFKLDEFQGTEEERLAHPLRRENV